MILKVVLCSLYHNQNIKNIVNSHALVWKNIENTCEKRKSQKNILQFMEKYKHTHIMHTVFGRLHMEVWLLKG